MGRTEKSAGIRWQLWTNIGISCVLLVLIIMAGRKVRHYVTNDPQFTLATPDERTPGLSMQGLVYTSRSRVLDTFEADFGRSIFLVPLPERRRRLLAVDWVEEAGIARVWPNRIDVRITERRPVAFVNLPVSGSMRSRLLMIDSQAVLLEQPAQSHFNFPVLSGVTEEQSELERRQRVRAMLRLLDDLGSLAKDVSEVNAANPENLIVITQMEGRVVELVMGNRHFSRRLQNFMEHYPEIRRRTGDLRAFDLRLDDRITAGGQTR
jgi:cell division septal protein FtsQ